MNKLKEICNIIYNTNEFSYLKNEEIYKRLDKIRDILINKWKESLCSDFSIYTHENYIAELIICYYWFSGKLIKPAIKYFIDNKIDYTNMKTLDDYNGIGISTIDLKKEFKIKDLSYFNNCKNQIKIFEKLCTYYNIFDIKRDENRNGKYDLIFSFENIEHYRNPLEYFNILMNILNPNGYIVYSQAFSNFSLGHFYTYFIEKTYYSNKKTARKFNTIVREYFDILYVGFNGRPIIIQKKE